MVNEMRGTLPPTEVLRRAQEGCLIDGSKSCVQDVDVFMGANIVQHNGKAYLHCGVTKTRGGEIIVDAKKYFFLPFPELSPIPGSEVGIYSLPPVTHVRNNGSEGLGNLFEDD
jgi:hypothetical protein